MKNNSSDAESLCGFTFKHYKDILTLAKQNGYEFISMEDYANGKRAEKILMIRHDIDFSPQSALEFAKIEHELGAKATYFVRVNADNYNPFGFKTYNALRKIMDFGHDMGLHYEHIDLAEITKQDPSILIVKEKELLELIFDTQINGIAPHRDFTQINNSEFWNERNIREFGFSFEAYMDQFLENIFYITDSLGNWGGDGKCLCELIPKEQRIYALLHPCYWYHTSYHLEREY
ncbi:MAG: hypothetical protein JSW00_15280 [Thermoplasmata archaeon]|nr:MAG: hypothetical protein JSW00_15280 [Thermoplasmata archaeon]